VFILRYIGPFLKINSLNKENIKNQLFHLAKESEKIIVFYSKFGISTYTKEFRHKIIPNNDISTFNSFSPLLCVYKKGDCELEFSDNKARWMEDKFKREIPISSNAFMTLSILELSKYYRGLETIHSDKSNLGSIYTELGRKQLEFYATNLRNFEGVFVDKKDISDSSDSELKLEEKSSKFNFSDQALLMSAFYSCSQLSNDKDSIQFKNFSLDILNMLEGYKGDIYNLSSEEILKVCLALNVFYDYSRNKSSLALLLDLYDYVLEKLESKAEDEEETPDINIQCLCCINSSLIYKHTGFFNYKKNVREILERLKQTYNSENHIFVKDKDKKETNYSSEEILLYVVSTLVSSAEDENDNIISNIFKRQIIESGIINSWPDVPSLGNPERYKNFSLNSEDLLNEQNFKMPTIPTPETSETAPVFLKSITYNKKKNTFTKSKNSFYSNQNMFLFFLFIYLFKPTHKIASVRSSKEESIKYSSKTSSKNSNKQYVKFNENNNSHHNKNNKNKHTKNNNMPKENNSNLKTS